MMMIVVVEVAKGISMMGAAVIMMMVMRMIMKVMVEGKLIVDVKMEWIGKERTRAWYW